VVVTVRGKIGLNLRLLPARLKASSCTSLFVAR